MKIHNFILLFLLATIIILEIAYVSNTQHIEEEKDNNINYTNIKPEPYYHILKFEIQNPKIYLAINDTKKIEYYLEVEKNYEEEIKFISKNPDIAQVDEQGRIKGLTNGEAIIEMKIKDKIQKIEVIVTNLINKLPQTPISNKKILTCNLYTKEQNDLLDEILKDRVDKAGRKTRAGVLAAARFITLEFPYRLSYFSENGRLTTYGNTTYADGEGRYYHEGLYLHQSRTSNIIKSIYGPNPWGCYIYSNPAEGQRKNGFDCSGFIAWILLNGGYNPGDIGAGISNVRNMTDLGTKKQLNKSLINNEIKAGDLLSGPNKNGGHIAMVIGIMGNKYFVAESLWGNKDYGTIAKTYTKESLLNNFYWHIDMEDYYKEEGDYSEYWF